MEIVMKPFILIYHAVSKILSFPTKIIKKSSKELEENIEQKKLEKSKEESTVAPQIDGKDSTNLIEDKDQKDNFNGITSEKKSKPTKPLISYRYTVLNSNKKKVTGVFEAESENDVKGFLTTEGYEIVTLNVKKPYDIELGGNGKLKIGALAFGLTQLSTYIKAGIPLVDAVRILSKQSVNLNEKRAYQRLVYDLLKGENLSDAMMRQENKFPKLLVNMVKTAEMTGDLPTILDDMADYYTAMEETRKQMISAMTYPVIVLLLAIAVLIFMLVYLVPQFVQMFESQDATLPAITLFIIDASNFLKNNYVWIILILGIFIGSFIYLYKNIKPFKKGIQTALMHVPVFGNIIIYNEVANFTKTFASLLNHGVFITDSMEILSKITNNEVYKRIIAKSLDNLGKGEAISKAFKGEWAFPVVAYEMLVTGENTGQLGVMMEKVASHFQSLHKSLVNQIKSLIEPIMIIILAVIVGVILLSIVVPMFDIYGKIQ